MRNSNPYLVHNDGFSDFVIHFKKWVLGVGLPGFLIVSGMRVVLAGEADVPVPPRHSSELIIWMGLKTPGIYWYGLAQWGIAMFLVGRYFWRYFPQRWQYHVLVEAIGGGLGVTGVAMTSVYLWLTHF